MHAYIHIYLLAYLLFQVLGRGFDLFSDLISQNQTIIVLFRFFGWINVGDHHYDIFTFLSTPIWYRCSTSLLKIASCTLSTGHGLAWCGLVPGCSSIHTGVLFVPRVISNRNLYLVSRLCILLRLYSVNFYYLIQPCVGRIFHSGRLIFSMYASWRPVHDCSPIIIHSKRFRCETVQIMQ